jgi:hypothetical protein
MGYRRIHGELHNLDRKIAASTVSEISKQADIDPAPQRTDRSWATFLTAQARGILAVDVLHVDTIFLQQLFDLFFIEHGTRRVHIASVTRNITAEWATQQPRNLLMSLNDTRTAGYFTEGFDATFTAIAARVVPTLSSVPRMNAIAERWIGPCSRETTDRTLITVLRTVSSMALQVRGDSKVARVGPSGRTVMPYTAFTGAEQKARVWAGSKRSSSTVDSRSANCKPRQARGPMPKGR